MSTTDPKTRRRHRLGQQVGEFLGAAAQFIFTPGGKPLRSTDMRMIAGRDTVVWSRYFAPYLVVDIILVTEGLGIDTKTRSLALSLALAGAFASFVAMIAAYALHNVSVDRVHAYNRGELPELMTDPKTQLAASIPLLLSFRLGNFVAFLCVAQLILTLKHLFPALPTWIAALLTVLVWPLARSADRSHHHNSLRPAE